VERVLGDLQSGHTLYIYVTVEKYMYITILMLGMM